MSLHAWLENVGYLPVKLFSIWMCYVMNCPLEKLLCSLTAEQTWIPASSERWNFVWLHEISIISLSFTCSFIIPKPYIHLFSPLPHFTVQLAILILDYKTTDWHIRSLHCCEHHQAWERDINEHSRAQEREILLHAFKTPVIILHSDFVSMTMTFTYQCKKD